MWCEGICVVCTWQPPLLSLRLFSLVWLSVWAEEPSCMLEAQLLWCPPALAESTGHTCWQLDLLVWSCVCVHEYMDVCIHVVHLATVSRSSLVEIDVFALFMRLYELWDYLSHSHHHTLSLRGLHSCKHPHQRYIITLAKKNCFTFLLILPHLESCMQISQIMHIDHASATATTPRGWSLAHAYERGQRMRMTKTEWPCVCTIQTQWTHVSLVLHTTCIQRISVRLLYSWR